VNVPTTFFSVSGYFHPPFTNISTAPCSQTHSSHARAQVPPIQRYAKLQGVGRNDIGTGFLPCTSDGPSVTINQYSTFVHSFIHHSRYTGCPRRNVPDFGRVFFMLKYTHITQNTYVQSWTVTEIMAREKCGLLAGPHIVPVSWQSYPFPSLSVVSYDGNSAHASHRTARVFPYTGMRSQPCYVTAGHSHV